MRFYVMVQTKVVYGWHKTLSLIPDALLHGASEFGPAISELTVTFNFARRDPPRRTLEQDYALLCETLPRIVFRRKRGEVVIDIASNLIDGEALEQPSELSLPLFMGGAIATRNALELLRKRLTAKDDFQLESFLSHCGKALAHLPSTMDALSKFASQRDVERNKRHEALTPWEQIDVDWRDYHPNAREILNDPFFWESANDFSPNGNDTGADLLYEYRKWRRRNPNGDPILFYKKLLRSWGLNDVPTSDTYVRTFDEAAIALAFAELKIGAECSAAVKSLAKEAIGRLRQQATNDVDWTMRAERLNTLLLIESVLTH